MVCITARPGLGFDLDVIGLREPSSSEPVRLRCLVFPFDSLLRQNSHMALCRRQDAQDRKLDSTGAVVLVADPAIRIRQDKIVSLIPSFFPLSLCAASLSLSSILHSSVTAPTQRQTATWHSSTRALTIIESRQILEQEETAQSHNPPAQPAIAAPLLLQRQAKKSILLLHYVCGQGRVRCCSQHQWRSSQIRTANEFVWSAKATQEALR